MFTNRQMNLRLGEEGRWKSFTFLYFLSICTRTLNFIPVFSAVTVISLHKQITIVQGIGTIIAYSAVRCLFYSKKY